MRQKSHINWNLPENDTKLRRFRRYLRDNGLRPSTLWAEYLKRTTWARDEDQQKFLEGMAKGA
jgi:hypothetical protein